MSTNARVFYGDARWFGGFFVPARFSIILSFYIHFVVSLTPRKEKFFSVCKSERGEDAKLLLLHKATHVQLGQHRGRAPICIENQIYEIAFH